MSTMKGTGLRWVLKREPSAHRKLLGGLLSMVFAAEWVYAIWRPAPPPVVAPVALVVSPKPETMTLAKPIPVPITPPVAVPVQPESPAPSVLPKGTFSPHYAKDAELHLIGVYEGHDPTDDDRPWWSKCTGDLHNSVNARECHARYAANHKQGFVEVNITYNQHPIILALTAYSPVKWKVIQGYGVVIEEVILAGYHRQIVEGIDTRIPVRVYTYEPSSCERCWQAGGHFYTYQSERGAYGFESTEKRLFEITGKRVSSLQTRYKGDRFSIAPGIPIISYPEPEKK